VELFCGVCSRIYVILNTVANALKCCRGVAFRTGVSRFVSRLRTDGFQDLVLIAELKEAFFYTLNGVCCPRYKLSMLDMHMLVLSFKLIGAQVIRGR
jgi:hypothetical protein